MTNATSFRRTLLGAMGAASLLHGASTKPNFVFILADDIGIGGISC